MSSLVDKWRNVRKTGDSIDKHRKILENDITKSTKIITAIDNLDGQKISKRQGIPTTALITFLKSV